MAPIRLSRIRPHPSETMADQVNIAISRPARHPSRGAWPALFIFKSKWKFELQCPVLLKMRQRDRQQGYGLLIGMIRERHTNKLLGDFGKDGSR